MKEISLWLSRPLTELNNNRVGMKPSQWGSFLWYYLFTTCYYFEHEYITNKTSISMLELIKSLTKILFCRDCRHALIDFCFVHNPEDEIGPSFFIVEWLGHLKNFVNKKLYKTIFPLDQVINTYLIHSGEKKYWHIYKEPTIEYQDTFWVILYCSVFNYPPILDLSSERDQEIHIYTHKFIELVTNDLLIGKEKKWKWSQDIIKHKPTPILPIWETRLMAVTYMYEWQSHTRHAGRFGSSLTLVIDYFERVFRAAATVNSNNTIETNL